MVVNVGVEWPEVKAKRAQGGGRLENDSKWEGMGVCFSSGEEPSVFTGCGCGV